MLRYAIVLELMHGLMALQLLAGEPTPRKSLKKADFALLPHHKLPGHEQESFSPAINKRSSLVGKAGDAEEPVFGRLYKQAATKMATRKAAIVCAIVFS